MFLLFLITLPILNSVFGCPLVKTCLHGGDFSNKTCTCDCGNFEAENIY